MLRDSPHVRGCIAIDAFGRFAKAGFPACAGLYRWATFEEMEDAWVPRMCGVVSRKHKLYTLLKENPPHMRGCIYKKANMITGKKEFPACAGLHRKVNVSW